MKIKLAITIFFLSIFCCIRSQNLKKVVLEFGNSPIANSKKHFLYNTNEHWYFEGRVGYRFNRYFETSLSIAYQKRSYIYFALFQQPYREAALFMKRYYLPVALNGRLYLSEFFYEKLKLWKQQNKWDVYTQLSVVTIKGKDVADSRENEARLAGGIVPYYKYPYVDVYNRVHISYILGVRYNWSKRSGLFIEGGEGLLTNALIGVSTTF